MNHLFFFLLVVLSTFYSAPEKPLLIKSSTAIVPEGSQNQKNPGSLNESWEFLTFNFFENKECDDEYRPVTGKDNRCYLNACWAKKKRVKIKNEGYDSLNYNRNDLYTWPIERVCIPIYKTAPVIKSLNDGTLHYLYENKEFRGTPNYCRCLPSSAKISCPRGEVEIKDLQQGDSVLTINQLGEKIAAPIQLINKVTVSEHHTMVYIELADKRKIKISPGHPSSENNSTLDEFEAGDVYDGSIIIKKQYLIYKEEYTYDILPESATGCYWANDILIGSTLLFWKNLVIK